MRTHGIAWALTLGFALTLLAGPISSAYPVDRDIGLPVAQDGGIDARYEAHDGALRRTEGDYVRIGLLVRWGYLDDPAVAVLEGRWRWNEDRTGGTFLGRWHLVGARVGGSLHGMFLLPDDGHGRFRGEWNASESRETGFLWGAWIRIERGHGIFDGDWNYSSGREGGALTGRWASLSEDGGGFAGHGIAAPSLRPVSWDGFLHTSDGGVRVVRTIRWEGARDREFDGEDRVLRQRERSTIEWLSTTTVNWDGLLFELRIPKARPAPHVVLHTDQASFRWEASELIGLHVREAVDRLGHEIEIRGFLIERHRDRDVGRLGIGIRWGLLDGTGRDDPTGDRTPWDGAARISDGGLLVRYAFSFERGDVILPREDRQSVRWETSTTTGWDGVLLVALVPLDEVPDATFTVKAGAFEHEFPLRDLPGRYLFDVGSEGHQVEVRAKRG